MGISRRLFSGSQMNIIRHPIMLPSRSQYSTSKLSYSFLENKNNNNNNNNPTLFSKCNRPTRLQSKSPHLSQDIDLSSGTLEPIKIKDIEADDQEENIKKYLDGMRISTGGLETQRWIDLVEERQVVEEEKSEQRRRSGIGARRTPLVEVNPSPKKGLSSKVIDYIENLIVKMMYDTSQPLHFLSGNFAPVDETPPVQNLPVTGHLPECLNGEFVRVGPNPKFSPVAGYHWFDGDGMIHGMRIKDGKATYVRRFVRTSRLKQEEFLRSSKFMKIGDLKGLFGSLMVIMELLRTKMEVLDMSFGHGTANTNLIYHKGKLLALQERDKPYVIKVLENGDLQTIGILDYDQRLEHPFTAHPKVDPVTGEMFTFGYANEPPYITYRVISKDGIMLDPVPITISEPIMVHDFAITENYAIFMDLPFYFRPKEMVQGKKQIFKFDEAKKSRFGVLPRYAKDEREIRWFELPNCFIFHNANAWEENDEVVLITCRLKNPGLEESDETLNGNLEGTNELYEMRFNMKTGVASQKKLSASAVDFPRINESHTGRKQRFVYATILDSIVKVSGIVKFDLHAEPHKDKMKLQVGGNIKGVFHLGPNRFGSEAVFVPRSPGINSEEDDGYLIFFVHDENTGKSSMNVIDAKTMSPDPVAVVELPYRVPYGFHAFFVTEEQLQKQATL